MKTKDVVTRLKEALTPHFAEQGFKQEKAGFEYTADVEDRLDFFSIYVECFPNGCSINTHADIQLKSVEMLVCGILEKNYSFATGATLGRRIEVNGESYWFLYRIEDLSLACAFIKASMAGALTFFQQMSDLTAALDFLLALPAEPFRSQRVLACAFLVGRYDIVVQLSEQVRDKFVWMLDDEAKSQHYLDFCYVADYLLEKTP